ncbi:MAG: hypothetical protein ACRD6W_01845, partial [Nitrososphaerales archaeon]
APIKPDFHNGKTYCLWGFAGEDGGVVEREFDVSVWDLPDGTHEVKTKLVSGPPIPAGSVPLEGIMDANWDGDNNFLNYILINAGHADEAKINEHL